MDKNQHLGIILGLSTGFSFGTIGVISALLRNLNVSSFEQLSLRLIFTAFLAGNILVFVYFNQQQLFFQTLEWKFLRVFIIQGVLVLLMSFFFVTAVALNIPVAEGSLLIQIHPIFTLILAYFTLGEQITAKKVTAIGLAIFGVVLLLNPFDWSSFLSSFAGNMFAMLTGFTFAFYIIISRLTSADRVDIPQYLSLAWIFLFSSLFLPFFRILLTLLFSTEAIVKFDVISLLNAEILGLGFLLAIFGTITPYSCAFVATKFIQSSEISLLALSEPFVAAILGFVILQEQLRLLGVAGGFLLLLAIIILQRSMNEAST